MPGLEARPQLSRISFHRSEQGDPISRPAPLLPRFNMAKKSFRLFCTLLF